MHLQLGQGGSLHTALQHSIDLGMCLELQVLIDPWLVGNLSFAQQVRCCRKKKGLCMVFRAPCIIIFSSASWIHHMDMFLIIMRPLLAP